jgi:hypothetical protein
VPYPRVAAAMPADNHRKVGNSVPQLMRAKADILSLNENRSWKNCCPHSGLQKNGFNCDGFAIYLG